MAWFLILILSVGVVCVHNDSKFLMITYAGKTLQDGSQEVGSLGMKEGSRLIVMGRKVTYVAQNVSLIHR